VCVCVCVCVSSDTCVCVCVCVCVARAHAPWRSHWHALAKQVCGFVFRIFLLGGRADVMAHVAAELTVVLRW